MRYTKYVFLVILIFAVYFLTGSHVWANNLDFGVDLEKCDEKATCKWNFGNGSIAKGKCATRNYSYSKPGNYTITITMDCGQIKQSVTRNIHIDKPQEGCEYSLYDYHVTYDEDVYNYNWNGKTVCSKYENWDNNPTECKTDGFRYYRGDYEDYESINCYVSYTRYEICREYIGQ